MKALALFLVVTLSVSGFAIQRAGCGPRKLAALSAWRSLSDSDSEGTKALNLILNRVDQIVKTGGTPIGLFDLDDTVSDTRTRTRRVLQAFTKLPQIAETPEYQEAITRVKGLRMDQIEFSVVDTLKNLRIENAKFITEANRFFRKNFFSPEFVELDNPIPGAVGFVNEFYRRGGTIVYLTGRDRPTMLESTINNLRRYQLPHEGPKVHLMLKPTKFMKDLIFKKQSYDQIRAIGTVVAGFENEPKNINSFAEAFPEATMVFVDSQHSPQADKPSPGIFRIKRYLWNKNN